MYVAEAFTSQICSQCKTKSLINTISARSKRKVYVVLKCNSCCTVWNHDVMAAKNIYYIFTHMSQHSNERLPGYMNSISFEDPITGKLYKCFFHGKLTFTFTVCSISNYLNLIIPIIIKFLLLRFQVDFSFFFYFFLKT